MATDPPTPPDPTSIPDPASVEKWTTAANAAGTSVDKFIDGIKKAGIDINTFSAGVDLATIGLTRASTSFSNFSKNLGTLQTFSDQITSLGNDTASLEGVFTKLPLGIGLAGKALADFAGKTALAMDNAVNLQQGYLATSAATGELGQAFDANGNILLNLNDVMLNHGLRLADIAGATNSSLGAVSKAYEELGKIIPNSMNTQIMAADNAGKSMNGLQAAMTLAMGTGRSTTDVIDDLKIAMENFAASEEQGLEWTAKMTDMSTKLGLNFSYTEGFMKANADAFKRISDNAGDADNTLARMINSFRDTGLSAKQSTEIIGDMTKGLSQLTLGQKAFMSAQSGGPGGVRGALQIENMLREGKTDEVMKMAEDNLKKRFGGQIYSAKEAEGSDYAAGQFLKQRQMLQSGAFGIGKGTDDATATRILEAMKKGTGAGVLEDPKNILQKAMTRGEELQQTTNNLLTRQLNVLERSKVFAGFDALNQTQRLTGTARNSERGEGSQDLSSFLKQSSDLFGRRAIARGTTNNSVMPFSKENEVQSRNLDEKQLFDFTEKAFKTDLIGPLKELFSNKKTQKQGADDYSQLMDSLNSAQKEIENIGAHKTLTDTQKTDYESLRYKKSQLEQEFGVTKPTRATGTAQAVQNAQAANRGPAVTPIQNGNAGVRRPSGKDGEKSEVIVTINGVVCESCHKPISPSTHSEVINQGTFHK